jgi:hypothetical protein
MHPLQYVTGTEGIVTSAESATSSAFEETGKNEKNE